MTFKLKSREYKSVSFIPAGSDVKENFKRISEKLEGTVMVAPESAGPIVISETRFDFKWWTYLYNDYPELANRYINALNIQSNRHYV